MRAIFWNKGRVIPDSSASFYERCRVWANLNRTTLGAAGVIAVAAVIAYHNSFFGPFIFDDITSIPYNPSIRQLWPFWEVLFPSHQDVATVNGRPLINLTFALNHAVSGTSVWSYHVVNLIILILGGITLLGVVRRTLLQPALKEKFGKDALLLAAVIALLWTVHPLQTESVTYITQRCESLMGLFYLLTIYGLIRATEAGGDRRWLVVSVVACFLGTASKEVMISAPLIVLLYDRTFVAGTFRKALTARKAYYAALACMWLFTGWMMARAGTRADTVGYVPGLTPQIYVLNEFYSLVHYLCLAIWPYPQIFDYGTPRISNLGQVWFDALIVMALGAGILFSLRCAPTAANPWPVLGFLGCWYFIILAPSSSFIPVKDVTVEHRMYLSLVVVIALVVSAVYTWLGRRGLAVFLLVVPIYITLTILRNDDYRSVVSLWGDTVMKLPLNARAQGNLAYALAAEGKTQEAEEHYQAALKIDPNDSRAHSNLGAIFVQRGDIPDATAQYQEALRLDPNNGAAHTNLGVMLAQMGENTKAMEEFEKALKCDHQDAEAHNNLGVALAGLGKMDEAVEQYEAAILINPDYADAHGNLGAALGGMGKLSEAKAEYEEVLRINPQDAEAHYNLGVALTGLGRIPEAMEQYEAALKIRPDYAHARNNLAYLRAKTDSQN